MKNIGLKKILLEQSEYGSVWEGDFDSNASEQSWREFWQTYFLFGPSVAVSKEVSSWHGERKLIRYQTPLDNLFDTRLELPENWKVYKINSGTKSSDFLEGVKSDNNGEYLIYNSPQGNLKFYLPNSEFFNNFSNSVYKFETDTGEIYTLVLSLNSRRSKATLSLGSDTDTDDITISLKNSNPNGGNGWFFDIPVLQRGVKPYFKSIGGNNLIPFSTSVYEESVKSSFQLFWEKWGVLLQIIGSIILATFTSGLSTFFETLFLSLSELEALTAGGVGVFAQMEAWLVASGSFSVARSQVLAMFLLETAINLPSAFIDRGFNNKLGFALGVAFCFFPLVSTYGKLGKWIKGNYTEEGAKKLAEKILNSGISESSSPEMIYRFITEELNSTEKMMFSEAMKLLGNEEGAKTLVEVMKESMKSAVINKQFPSKWKQFISSTKYSETIKTFLAAGVYFIDVTKWLLIIEKLKDLKGFKESPEEIIEKAQKSVNEIKKPFIKTETSTIKFTKSDDIIKDYINGLSEEEGANAIFSLAKGNNEDIKKYINLIAEKRNKEFINYIKNIKKETDITKNMMMNLLNDWKEINQNLYEPKSETDFYQMFNQEEIDDTVSKFISEYDKDPMTNELKQTVTKYPCLSTNFNYKDGNSWFEGKWALNFEVTKPIKVSHSGGVKIDLKVGDDFWIYWPSGIFRVNGFDFEDFNCS